MGNCEDENAAAVKGESNTTVNQGPGGDTAVIICNIFCFYGDTIVKVLENKKLKEKHISEIKKGELVQTYNGKELIFTKVKENIKNKGLFTFYEIKCKNENLDTKSISITWNHKMIIYNKSKKEIKLKCANEVKIGDIFRTKYGFFEVFEINKKIMNDCYELAAENGTVLANDIFVTTVYLNRNHSNKNCQKIIDSAKIPIDILN